MTNRERLALHVDSELAHDACGDESGPLEVRAGDDDLMKWLKVSNRFALLEKNQREDRAAINRILTRFASLGQPIREEDSAA